MIECEWRSMITGERLCSEPALYLAFTKDCEDCEDAGHPECQGGAVCEKHAARERVENPDLIRITSLQAVAVTL